MAQCPLHATAASTKNSLSFSIWYNVPSINLALLATSQSHLVLDNGEGCALRFPQPLGTLWRSGVAQGKAVEIYPSQCSIMLKHCVPEFLEQIYRFLIQSGKPVPFRSPGKQCKLVPKPNKALMEIRLYHPVALISGLGKLLERLSWHGNLKLQTAPVTTSLGFGNGEALMMPYCITHGQNVWGVPKSESTITHLDLFWGHIWQPISHNHFITMYEAEIKG